MAALLAARLSNNLVKNLKFKLTQKFWTDSSITYFWIRGLPNRFKPFVKNRVVEIQQLTDPEHWFHCPGKENPADLVSRGLKASELINNTLWWEGPPFLKKRVDSWPQTFETSPEENLLEFRKKKEEIPSFCFSTSSNDLRINPENYSCFLKFLRITGLLTSSEIEEAEEFWVKFEQRKAYHSEILALESGKEIDKNSSIRSFAPFLDDKKVLRIGDRLENSEFDLEQKHPILLPNKCKFTELLIRNEHEGIFPGGVSATLPKIRNRFWIAGGRQLIKKIIKSCIICRKYSALPAKQITSPLPKDRVSESPPFSVCGVDFAGPIYAKTSNTPEKAYICLFTCAVTRALRRFISRREIVQTIYSDNAKTFKSANKELQFIFNFIQDPKIQNFIANKRIKWKFIMERAAWWGGFYERLVKSVKECLRKTLSKSLLTFEELTTILTDIESVLNQRPLSFVYSDFNEPEPLTPAHFLLPQKKIDLPLYYTETLFEHSNRSPLIKRKLFQMRLLQNFWTKWKEQYVLLKTAHWLTTSENQLNLQVQDVVLIEGAQKNKLLWSLGVIEEVYLGRDGKVWSCLVRTNGSRIRRPVQLLYPFEILNNA
ncbi:uncharacterized protein [Parasteatoda tepidariorum]|uniref:uncharacterized protein n=1 Tax=Parasteatoda tepidariorum TaxID=114398 RepID=UPI0039BD8FC1